VDGDAHCYTIAAAGILAKTVRDDLMLRLGRRYPAFGWGSNMGYGTATHLAALTERGPTPHHRRSFAPVSQLRL
jgi:ribonuclease HII